MSKINSYLFLVCIILLCSCDDKLAFIKVPETIPSIRHISPSSGSVGTAVTIEGSHFSKSIEKNIVTFNGVDANIVSSSSTKLIVLAPEEGSSGPVKVMVRGKQANSILIFTYTN